MTLLDRYNWILHGFAALTNPFGYRQGTLPPPTNVGGLQARLAAHDAAHEPAGVSHASPFTFASCGVDVLAFYAHHERVHAATGLELDHDGELRAFGIQHRLYACFDDAAASLHMAIVLTHAQWWRNGGTDSPPKAPQAVCTIIDRMDRRSAFLRLGRDQRDVHEAFGFFQAHMEPDFHDLCTKDVPGACLDLPVNEKY